MDPLSQGLVGASFSQNAVKKKKYLRIAAILGFLSGMAPDLDIFIHSQQDPLLHLEYHRQFTHSLIFIPFGGLLCALVSHIFTKNKIGFLQAYIFCTLGWATHGLLDVCTTYGTLLLWPFSNHRFAWNNVSIIDPLLTLPLLALMILSFVKKRKLYAYIGSAFIVFYLSFGLMQAARARSYIRTIGLERQHSIEELMVSPSLGNLILWRTVYQHEGDYYVDAVRVGFKKKLFEGAKVKKLSKYRDMPWLVKGSVQDKDIERFRWFTNNYLSWSKDHPYAVQDVRYAISPRSTKSIWGLWLSPINQSQHGQFDRIGERSEKDKKDFFQMLFNSDKNDPKP